jgi:two-component system, sensor histidine kinase and response regulator
MPHILIVDDEPYQRMLIRETLAGDPSFTFREADDGVQALQEVKRQRPDVILLDVMMPKMGGFEVCQTLKADSAYQAIPIILVTALGQLQDKITGLDSGADDFVNKPFEESELQARVRSALRIKAMHDQLQNLLHLRDDLVRMIMHDMGNMVAVISSALSLYQRVPPDSEQAIQFAQDAYEANLSLADMISDALDVSSIETQKMPIHREQTDLVALTRALLESFRGAAMETDVKLDLQIENGFDPFANVDPSLIRRVIGNLVTNALKHAPASSHIAINLGQNSSHETVCLSVTDQGPGISPEEQTLIFNKYEMARLYADRRERPGRGLGLTFSKLAVEAHRGTISVQSTVGEGATFTVDLPRS